MRGIVLSITVNLNQRGRTHGRTETATAIRDSISNSFLVLWILIKIFSGLSILPRFVFCITVFFVERNCSNFHESRQ